MSDWGRREPAGERIEIELTTFEPRTKAPQDDPQPDPSAIEPGDHAHDEGGGSSRRTLIVTAAAVGVVALVLGWALGRASGAETSDTGTTTPTASTIAVTTAERITDTIAPPVTTARPRPSTTTTTTLPPGTPIDVPLSPELRALPYELAILDSSRSMYRINLPAATVRTYPGSPSTEQSSVAFRPDGSVLTYARWADGSTPTIITLDGKKTPLKAEVDFNQQLLVDGVGGLWRLRTNGELELLADGREPTGEPLTMTPNMQMRSDPAGGVLISGPNGTFAFGASGEARRVSTGDIVAAGADTLIAHECTDDFSCDHVVIDRLTGARTPIDLDELARTAPPPVGGIEPGEATRRIVPAGWFDGGASAAVVGRFAVIGVDTMRRDVPIYWYYLVVDLDRVETTAHIAGAYSSGIVMSPDGLWGFAPSASGTILTAIELATGSQIEVELPMAEIFDIAIRST